MRTVLIGGGAFGREILCWASDAAQHGSFQTPTEYLDDGGPTLEGFDYDLQYLGTLRDLSLSPGDSVLISIGDPAVRAQIIAKLGAGVTCATLVHPTCVVARTATLMEGVVMGPHGYVAADAKVGKGSILNSFVGVGHDAVIESCVTVSSQVDIMGKVTIAERAFIGSGARILPGVAIGEAAKVGAGAIVVRSVKAGATVFSSPARML